MKNIIVITGGAGFIGSHLIEIFLRKTSKKIVSIDNYKYGSKKNEIKSNRVEYINGNTKNISNLLKNYKKKIDTVFHFGEYARIHQSFKDFEECISSNVGGTSEVLNFCLKNKIRIIYSATSATLGNKGNDQYLSPYAFTKARNLKTILQLNAWFGLRFEIMYFYNVYGKRHISEGNMATVIGIFENHYLKKKPLPVVKPGTQSRKFTHIDDTINGCFFAWKKNKNRHYSLANNKSLKIIKVAKLFSNRIKYLKPRLGERYKSVVTNRVSNQKIYSIECKKSLQEYISKFKQENNR